MAAAPTITEIRAWSDLDFATYGYPEGGDGDIRLQLQLDRALMYLGYVTGRQYTDPQTDQFGLVKTGMDQAVQMRTEQVILALAGDQLDSVADIDLIASFSAGSYSETRRDTVAEQQKMLNPWPTLNDLLWMLLGLFPGEVNAVVDERYDYWRALLMGIQKPAWGVVEVDWARGLGQPAWPYGQNVLGGIDGLIGPLPDPRFP
jgi:hypothetical protein